MAVGQLGATTRGQESFRLPNLVSPSEQLIPSSHTHEITNSQQLGNSSGGRNAGGKSSLPGAWMDAHKFPQDKKTAGEFL